MKNKDAKVYVIGDLHFGHNNILKFRREFETVEEHNDTIHNNILAVASKKNTLWLMGDLVFKPNQIWRIEEYAKKFGKVNITLGNHDHPKLVDVMSKYPNVSFHGLAKKYGFWFSHAPVHPQELYRCRSIHGHVHGNTLPDHKNYFNASCENVDYTPILLETIRDFMDDGRGMSQLTRLRLWLSTKLMPMNQRKPTKGK